MKIQAHSKNYKGKVFCFLFFVFLTSLFLFTNAMSLKAADLYVSTHGTKTAGYSSPGDWIDSNCYKSLQSAFEEMTSGDTLIIDDGYYSGAENTITGYVHPPSGSAGAPTVVRARHIPGQEGVPIATPLTVQLTDGLLAQAGGTPATYLKFEGIQFLRANTYTGWDYLYFKQCAFMGVLDGNTSAAGFGGANNLLEDCVFYGKGRYKLLFYDYTNSGRVANNLVRRGVARNDWANGGDCTDADCTNPIASFVSYDNSGDAFLNCIDVDSDSPEYWKLNGGEYDGAFYAPKVTGSNMLVQGSIVINNAAGFGSSTGGMGHQYIDVAGINNAGGIYHKAGATLNRVTMVGVDSGDFTYRSGQTMSQFLPHTMGVGGYVGTTIALNSIFRDLVTPTSVFLSNASGDHVNTYNTVTVGATPTNPITTDPYLNGLLYPVLVEAASSLLTAGSGGGQIGARIVNKLGVDGTFKGDTDWNTEQSALWPWPMEAWVKAQMASMPATIDSDTMPLATRGFCASEETLSGYIWGAIGNTIPLFHDVASPKYLRVVN